MTHLWTAVWWFAFSVQAYLAYGIPQNNVKRVFLLLKVRSLIRFFWRKFLFGFHFLTILLNSGCLQRWRSSSKCRYDTESYPWMPHVSPWTGRSIEMILFRSFLFLFLIGLFYCVDLGSYVKILGAERFKFWYLSFRHLFLGWTCFKRSKSF